MSSASYSLAAPGLASSTGVAEANPWSLLPPLGNLDAYISAVNRLPMLTLEQEQTFARELRSTHEYIKYKLKEMNKRIGVGVCP